MPIVRVENLGRIGVLKDTPDYELPPEAVTMLQNARVYNNAIHKIEGHNDMLGALIIEPWILLPWRLGAAYNWIYADAAAIYRNDGATETDITRIASAYTASSIPKWNGVVFQGLPILNNDNFADPPQSWDGSANMQDLPNWPATAYCKFFGAIKEFLVAAHMKEGSDEYHYKVVWSDATSPGAVPSTWLAAANNRAGNTIKLAATGDYITGMHPFGDTNVIFKEDHIWAMQFVGGNSVFSFTQMSDDFGMLTDHCAVNFKKKQLVVSKGDIIVHNVATWESIANKKVRDNIFRVMDQAAYDKTFVVLNRNFAEIWICYAETGETQPNIAAVWNYKEHSWSFRDIPSCRYAAQGLDPSAAASATFDAISGTFDTLTGWFNELPYNPSQNQLIFAGTPDKLLYRMDSTNQFEGVNFTTIIERTGLAIVGQDRQGNPKSDFHSEKMYRRIRPKMTGEGSVVNWYFGTQDQPDGAVSWEGPFEYTIGIDDFIDFDRPGKLLCYKVTDTADQTWSLSGLEIDMDKLGVY